jgi:acetyltransferase-like isoleucine patch superfamily enzyme
MIWIKNILTWFYYLALNRISIGDYINSIKGSTIGKKCKIYGSHKVIDSIVGDFTYISSNSKISNTVIGKYCSIGPNLISGWGIHPLNTISTSPMFYSTSLQNGLTVTTQNKIIERKLIEIGNDVFIGANVIILDGVKIGDGAVIGAGAVVSKNIPPYAIAVGCPIKILRYRFDEKTIDELLKVKWWDHTYDIHIDIEKYFFDIDFFLKKMKK